MHDNATRLLFNELFIDAYRTHIYINIGITHGKIKEQKNHRNWYIGCEFSVTMFKFLDAYHIIYYRYCTWFRQSGHFNQSIAERERMILFN